MTLSPHTSGASRAPSHPAFAHCVSVLDRTLAEDGPEVAFALAVETMSTVLAWAEAAESGDQALADEMTAFGVTPGDLTGLGHWLGEQAVVFARLLQ